jgi:hypothetical protein
VHRLIAEPELTAGQGTILESNATGDYVGYVLRDVAAGSYNVKVRVKKFSTRGIVQVSIGRADDYAGTFSNVGPVQDLYSGASAYVELDLGAWVPGTTGDKELRVRVTSKNSLSTGYTVCVDYIKLTPQ